MQKIEGMPIWANFRGLLYGPDGKLKDYREVHNTITSIGKQIAADQAMDVPTYLNKPGWLAVGEGTPSGTLLGSEIARVVLDSKIRLLNVVTMVCTIPAGVGTGALTEAGIFDVVTPNTVNMWMSASFGVMNKGALDPFIATWTLTFG